MFSLGAALLLGGCGSVPTSGPTRDAVVEPGQVLDTSPVQIVPVTERVARRLMSQRSVRLFSEGLKEAQVTFSVFGSGDSLEVTIWEAPPATLFGGAGSGIISGAREGAGSGAAGAITLPEQVVTSSGHISVPFAGQILVSGRTAQQVQDEIAGKLRDRANAPQVLVRAVRNTSSTVTIVGDVTTSMRMPLGQRSERVLDALAAAGGVRNPVNKVTLQITRGDMVLALPLEAVIRNPKENIRLQAGDVITALHQPLSFTAMGATGKNDEVNFEAQGISLAQAIARSGGLQDNRSDPQGVFIFRYERADALELTVPVPATTSNGLIPVIYTVDLRDPGSFFAVQTFDVQNKDVLYVSNAPLAELQKFANVVFSIAFPVLNLRR